MAKVCLSMLNSSDVWSQYPSICADKEDRPQPNSNGEDPANSDPVLGLLHYAINFWPFHVQKHGDCDIDPRLALLLKKLLGSMNESGPNYRKWYKACKDHHNRYPYPRLKNNISRFCDQLSPCSSSSIAICLFGFNNVLDRWWETKNVRFELNGQ